MSTHNDEEVEQFYEDVEEAMKKYKTPFSIVMGHFNAKIGMKNDGKTSIGPFWNRYKEWGEETNLLSLQSGADSESQTHSFRNKHSKNGAGKAKYSILLCMAFIDYEKAFNSVITSAVMQALRQQGIDELYIKLLEDIYRDTTATIQLHKKSRKILISKGVRQGNTISPKLFTAWLEGILKKLEWNDFGFKIDGEYLNNLRFADDIVLLSNSGEDLDKMVSDLHGESLKVGLKMNMKKTKIMYNKHLTGRQIMIGNKALELVKEYTYIGQMVSPNPAHEKEIRIGMGWSSFGKQSCNEYQFATLPEEKVL